MIAALRILDTHWRLDGPTEVIGPIVEAYARFQIDAASEHGNSNPTRQLCCDPDCVKPLTLDGRPLPWLPGVEPVRQVYRAFLTQLSRDLGRHVLLHAAALAAPDGTAVLIAAPSGRGKSTLTLNLLARGFDFLGDDYAPLDLERRTVAPYPRAVALVPGAPGTAALEAHAGGTLLGKRLLDVGRAFGEERVVDRDLPLGRVFVLGSLSRPEPWIDGSYDIEIGVRAADANDVLDRLNRLRGVRATRRPDAGVLVQARLQLDASAHGGDLQRALEDPRLLYVEKCWPLEERFHATTEARPIERSWTAQLLGREMLNRHGDGRLLARHGSLPALFFELIGALQTVPCYQVQPGPEAATADLVAALSAPGSDAGRNDAPSNVAGRDPRS